MISEIDNKKTSEVEPSPGMLILQGEKKVESTTITACEYTEQTLQEKVLEKIEDGFPLKSKPTITWINITGIHDTSVIEKIGGNLSVHPLVLEDILSTDNRPKVEDHNDYIFIILKALHFNSETNEILSDQVSIIMGSNFVVSIQERNDIFDPIRKRIRNPKSLYRKMGTGYLAYTLIDIIVDNYFNLLEKIEDRIESMEEELVNAPTTKTLQVIHQLKNELILMRKSIWPVREVVNTIERSESVLINKALKIYLRDLYDHIVQIIESIESLRDMVSGMLDIYLSSVSNRMNAVMKVLTIIATIFIPLTFIVGIYGMNFEFMPELSLKWAYPTLLGIMLIIAVAMIVFFKKRKWI